MVARLSMTYGYSQGCQLNGRSLHTGGILPLGSEPMRSFLDLDSSSDSTFSLQEDDCLHVDCHNQSFLRLSSSASSFESGVATKTVLNISQGAVDSVQGTPSLSLASFPTSETIITTCTSPRSSVSSQHRHAALHGALRKISPPQRPHSHRIGEGIHNVNGYELQRRRHEKKSKVRLLGLNMMEEAPKPTRKPQSRSIDWTNSPVYSPSKSWRSSSNGRSKSSDGFSLKMTMTKEEFEALPLTIQRKYFSQFERQRLLRSPDSNEVDTCAQQKLDTDPAALHSCDIDQTPTLRLSFGQGKLENAPCCRIQPKKNPLRICTSPEKTRRKCHYSRSGNLNAQRLRPRVKVDATGQPPFRQGKRQPQTSEPESLPTVRIESRSKIARMFSFAAKNPAPTGHEYMPSVESPDSTFEPFRWLDESEDLDLRLYLDDYHYNLRNHDAPAQSGRNPSFRRRLSITKFPFTIWTSASSSRPATKDVLPATSPQASAPGSPTQAHVRKTSRALSPIAANKQSTPTPPSIVDPAAAHYQDADARMKLRVHLASTLKFDEAVEFGFPSIEEIQVKGNSHKRATSQQERLSPGLCKLPLYTEDDKSSMYSDEASATDPDSPRTPATMDRPDEDSSTHQADYAQPPCASREMTLRMTLTRPDLRADEEQMYGWQKTFNGRKSQPKEESKPPVLLTRERYSKESIERQLAALDQGDLTAHDDGIMKRFWNRVRRP